MTITNETGANEMGSTVTSDTGKPRTQTRRYGVEWVEEAGMQDRRTPGGRDANGRKRGLFGR